MLYVLICWLIHLKKIMVCFNYVLDFLQLVSTYVHIASKVFIKENKKERVQLVITFNFPNFS
jgi:hypothetical protein